MPTLAQCSVSQECPNSVGGAGASGPTLGEGGGDAVVVADGASDPHQAAPERLGIAFTYVTDGGLTSPWS
jgi:hypothetical protein